MKAKLLISVVLVVLSMGFLYFKSSGDLPSAYSPASLANDNDFIIGVLDGGVDNGYNRLVNELGTNLWAKYTVPSQDVGWITFHNNYNITDTRDASLEQYQDYVFDVMDANSQNKMKTLMHRIKLEYLAYGQRSDYQCETESYLADPDYWFYTYKIHETGIDYTDNSSFGNGVRVRYCRTNPESMDVPGYVVRGLKANREQCATSVFSSAYQIDSRYRWYIKPRVRIDRDFANNPNNWNTNVCKIELYPFNNGQIPFKTIYIKVKNFLDNNDFYDGSYKEEYRIYPGEDSLIANGQDFNPNNGNWLETDTNAAGYSKVDIRVYWYGLCDMWIDYVRVDNEVAHDLFRGVYENPAFGKEWLKWEVQDIANQRPDNVFRFYIEEFEFNNRPCMKYVNDRIKQLSNNRFSLMCNVYWAGYNIHKPMFWKRAFTKEEFKRTLIDYVGLREIFMGSYPMHGYRHGHQGFFREEVYVPNTLPVNEYNPANGVFCEPKSPQDYDLWLQEWLDDPSYYFSRTGEFRFYNELSQYISKQANIPWYTIIQTHLWFDPNGPIYREPTNEELKLLVNLPITYGSKGILYFWFSAWNPIDTNCPFGRGITNPYPELPCNQTFPAHDANFQSRHDNVYKQNSLGIPPSSKYQTIADNNKRLKKWGHYLMAFDDGHTNSYIYRLQRNELINNTYFADVLSYKPYYGGPMPPCVEDNPDPTNTPYPEMIFECKEDVYLQVATFKNANNDNNKYFIIVNRRCSPFIDGSSPDRNGGRRFIRIRFDANHHEFSSFNNWNIIDLGNDRIVVTFDKRQSELLDLGWFMPGEGKLYKIVPVL